MNAKPCLKRPSILLGCLVGTLVSWCFTAQSQFPVTSGQVMRSLHQFDSTSQASQWQIVNDGVMGGRSTSGATITQAGTLQFSGNISLANNGGFASVRSRPTGAFLGLNSGDTIVMRVKGDGENTLSICTRPIDEPRSRIKWTFKPAAGNGKKFVCQSTTSLPIRLAAPSKQCD